MFNSLLKKLETKVNERKDVQTFADYCFKVKSILSAISNIENEKTPYKNLEYFKNTIKFEDYLGLEYMDYFTTSKQDSNAVAMEDERKVITKEDIEDPAFKAMIVVLMNIYLPMYVPIPDKIDPYECRDIKENVWYELLEFIIQDGTLDKDTIDWIMIFALINDRKHYNVVVDGINNEIIVNGNKTPYKEVIGEAYAKLVRYREIIAGIFMETKLTSTYMTRRFRYDKTDMYMVDLRYEAKHIPDFVKFLEFYRDSKYYNEYIEALYIGCPVFNCFKESKIQSIFRNRYRYSTDICTFKSFISEVAKHHNILISVANESKHYKDIFVEVDKTFVDTFINLVNERYYDLFSTKTMGALRRSKYEQRLNNVHFEGFKFMREIAY